MAKNTNPLTKSLLIKQNWNSIALPLRYNKSNTTVLQDLFITKIIHGTFLRIGLLTSQIHIARTCLNDITIQFLYYPLSLKKVNNSNLILTNHLLKLIKLIKLLLKSKFPQYNIKIVVIKAPHKFMDSKILNDYVQVSVLDEPNRIKFVINNLIREFKRISHKTTN